MDILNINNKDYEFSLTGYETLLEVLRDELGFTGTKTACSEAECGACSVIINGNSVLSCITLAKDCVGKKITTIEGLAKDDELHPIQQAFLDQGAVQCGFCIPGMIIATKTLLDKNPKPTEEEIQIGLDGNICRCAGYPQIMKAVKHASKIINKDND
ncbi:MAG: (2Fe-2S)-binding protein [Candidatus Omnitrophica bacterium]|nr:(2Fe-2S)-binding protein [Candidatus Omnitrophota bacterium]